ncbi:hypothetical protein [uncultured Acinetobacter sp.]|uniref:hypothetical protein n=1 Tax=uncultured Acinetobacter sp. TaxID=165433 RepID=UPI0025D35713|nr:hypothetical protein [uncultured Acinetobacter sp.]
MIKVKSPIKSISTRGFPWQPVYDHFSTRADKTVGDKFGWNPLKVSGMGRFGGGWAFKLGITTDHKLSDFVFCLGIGQVRITLKRGLLK